MIISDKPTKIIDEVIAEVRAVKRAISERHGNDIDRLLEALKLQEQAEGIHPTGQSVHREDLEDRKVNGS
jgi:hypothetical protein